MQRTRDYRRLSRKIVATTLYFSSEPLFALGLRIYALFSDSITTRMMESIKTLAENRHNAVDLFLDECIAQFHTLAYTHTFNELQDEEYLASVLNLLQVRGRAFIDLGVIDPAGNHAFYTGPYSLIGINYANERWFHEAVERGVYVRTSFRDLEETPLGHCCRASRRGQVLDPSSNYRCGWLRWPGKDSRGRKRGDTFENQ